VNQSLRFLQEQKRHGEEPLDWDVPDVPEEDDPPVRDVPPEVLHQMIRELPTGYRTVFNLYVFEDKTHQEIGQILGIGKDTSASQFSRAKNLLAKKINAYLSQKNSTYERRDP
jgi:RNA polymerase sigma-70 factor (ECF subfamily)